MTTGPFMGQNLRWTSDDLARIKAKQATAMTLSPAPIASPKFNNTPKVVGDVKFKSTLEANVYSIIIAAGFKPELQVRFNLLPDFNTPVTGKIKGINYDADFVIPVGEKRVVIEAKGYLTPHSKDKYKLYASRYGSLPLIIKSKSAALLLMELLKAGNVEEAEKEFARFKRLKFNAKKTNTQISRC